MFPAWKRLARHADYSQSGGRQEYIKRLLDQLTDKQQMPVVVTTRVHDESAALLSNNRFE